MLGVIKLAVVVLRQSMSVAEYEATFTFYAQQADLLVTGKTSLSILLSQTLFFFKKLFFPVDLPHKLHSKNPRLDFSLRDLFLLLINLSQVFSK